MKLDQKEPHTATDATIPRNFSAERRRFIQTVAVLGAGVCLADPGVMRAAVLAARNSGKMVLTEATLNTFIQSIFTKPPVVRQQMLAQAKTNFSAFINTYFTLTPAQQQSINSLSTGANLTTLQQLIDQAAATNKPVHVSITQAQAPAPTPGHPSARMKASASAQLNVDKSGKFSGATASVTVDY